MQVIIYTYNIYIITLIKTKHKLKHIKILTEIIYYSYCYHVL